MTAPTDRPTSYFLAGHAFESPPLAPGLYVVSTPIGNLRDITIRALETLAAADVIFCEDTRLSARLLDHYGIKTPRKPLHEHNERQRIEAILEDLSRGSSIALISDAGTPLVSDPGFPLVRALREEDRPVFAVPGASALLSALAVSGLPTDSFTFIGFLPPQTGARSNAIAAHKARTETMVFYESPRRLGPSLSDLAEGFGADREAVVALELTKRFERVHRGTLSALAELFNSEETKGEAVIVVAGAAAAPAVSEADWQEELVEALKDAPLRAAVDAITEKYKLKRKEVYNAALALKAGDEEA